MSHGLRASIKEKDKGLSFGGKDDRHYLYYRSSKAGCDKWFKKLMNRRHRREPILND